jgi:hypothetical protein
MRIERLASATNDQLTGRIPPGPVALMDSKE